MKNEKLRSKFVLCVRNQGAEDLEPRKLYQVLPNGDLSNDYVRVIDESGEDYLYPAEYFVPLKLPVAIVRERDASGTITYRRHSLNGLADPRANSRR